MLGADIPERLETEPASLIGRTLAVNGQPFEVIGILDGVGGGFGNQSPDFAALIPLRTAEQRVLGREEIDNISVRVAADASMERAMVDIERVLRSEHKLMPGNAERLLDRRSARVPRHAAGSATDLHDAARRASPASASSSAASAS